MPVCSKSVTCYHSYLLQPTAITATDYKIVLARRLFLYFYMNTRVVSTIFSVLPPYNYFIASCKLAAKNRPGMPRFSLRL